MQDCIIKNESKLAGNLLKGNLWVFNTLYCDLTEELHSC
jgi:hypothetical protein